MTCDGAIYRATPVLPPVTRSMSMQPTAAQRSHHGPPSVTTFKCTSRDVGAGDMDLVVLGISKGVFSYVLSVIDIERTEGP